MFTPVIAYGRNRPGAAMGTKEKGRQSDGPSMVNRLLISVGNRVTNGLDLT
jgi:hypothetical protein